MLLLIATVSSPADRDLMTEFYEKNINLLFYEAKKHLSIKEDVEDIVYEAFKKLIEKVDVFRTLAPKQQARYAVVTVRNLCYLHIRRSSNLNTISFDELNEEPAAPKTPEQIVDQKEFANQLQSIMRALDQEVRMLLEQKYILHWTDEEMAALYSIKTDSMRMKLSRAKRALQEQIELQNIRFPEM